MNKRGFTMIELMTVISIIAVLAAVLFPIFAKSRESARRVSCASNLEQIGMSLNMYAQAYDGHYPRKNNDFAALSSTLNSKDILRCPSDADSYDSSSVAPPPAGGGDARKNPVSSYVLKGGLTNDSRADTVMGGEIKAFHGDLVNVLYLGGHVRAVPSDGYKPVVAPNTAGRNANPYPQTMSGPPVPVPTPASPTAPPPPHVAKKRVTK